MRLETHRGHYALKQLMSPSRLIAWTHRRRFETALEFAKVFEGLRVLDFGCGDGTFLAMLMESEHAPDQGVGMEITEDLLRDCKERLGSIRGLSFVSKEQLAHPRYQGSFDGIICMEVLEHVVGRTTVLHRMADLLTPGGLLLLSVPVEIGPPLPVKQLARRIAGWRGIGDYPGTTPYTPPELISGLFAGSRQHIVRPIHLNADGSSFHDHKGFNWRVLREELRDRFEILETATSPIRWLSPLFASQVWFTAQRRA